MSTSGIPKQVEEILSTHRRGFLKTAGLLLVGFAAPGSRAADAPGPLSDRRSAETRLVDRDS